jgi:formate-nitrite transporter family protein
MAGREPRSAEAPDLEPHEHADALERTSPAASVVHEAVRQEGEVELARAPGALAWSGLAAGLSIGFSLIAEGLLQAHLPETAWRPLVSRLGYTVGFIVVILARQQLFTENTLTPVLPLLSRRDRMTLGRVLRLWGIVLAANLLGALALGLALAHLPVFEPQVTSAFEEIARTAMQGRSRDHFVQGIFAGWLIALMVWMLPAAKTSRIAVIVIVTYLIALGELTHVIAGAVDVSYLLARSLTTPLAALAWVLATLAGNVVGGLGLTAALNHAQVMSTAGESDPAAAT